MRSAVIVALVIGYAAVLCACAKAPDASSAPKAAPEASPDANANTSPQPSIDGGSRVPGLPMPQQVPRFAWDAAAAADAAPR